MNHRSFRFAAVAAVASLSALIPGSVVAENPNWPPVLGADHTDPATWPDEGGPENGTLGSGYGDQWNYWSWAPASAFNLRPEEVIAGSGFGADKAWELTIGRDDVLIAVLDSGARWQEQDLVNKWYLNEAELPEPDAGCAGGGAGTHDANGDGIFNIQDYTTAVGHEQPGAATICDTRVSDVNGNGVLDPGDLIALFSDGADDDSDGYIDNICGWDFFQNDNDAFDDTDFGHGTGEAKDSAAETNNGIGSAGVCPLCRVMPVRVGDSFVVDVNDFAMGAIFAVDSGALVIQEALGALNNNPLAMEAIDYAWDNGTVVVASAADEMSRHHNFPGSVNHTLYVHAVTFDDANQVYQNITTFLNFNNCTNYGGNLALSTPGEGCSSEATGRTSGIAGLLYSYARDLGIPDLTGGELAQLLTMTAFDINIPEGLAPRCDSDADCGSDQMCRVFYDGNLCADLCTNSCPDEDNFECINPGDGVFTCMPTKFPSYPGWEQYFGYGRPDIRAALDEMTADRIPPVVDVTSPLWFDYVVGAAGTSIDIVGSITTRYDSVDYVVEWARGIETSAPGSVWHEVANETGKTGPVTGLLASIPADTIHADRSIEGPPAEANSFTVTVRVRAMAHGAGLAGDEDAAGEFRKTFSVHRDPDLLPGYPIWMGASGESSPKLVDLDGDGADEIIYVTADGLVHAIANVGGMPGELPGFPHALDVLASADASDPANHLDTMAFASGAIDPVAARGSVNTTPAVGDLDGDGDWEIVIAALDAKLYVIDHLGARVDPFPVSPDPSLIALTDRDHELDSGFSIGSPALGDLDNDGDLEILAPGLDGWMHAYHHDGSVVSGFPVQPVDPGESDPVFRRLVSTPALGDLDKDGRLDIVVGSSEGYSGDTSGRVYAIHGDGNDHSGGPFHAGWPIRLTGGDLDVLPFIGQGVPQSPALADVDGDGVLEVAIEAVANTGTIYFADQSLSAPLSPATMGRMENYEYGPDSDAVDRPFVMLMSNGSFADLDMDGQVDFIKGGSGFNMLLSFASGGRRFVFDHMVGAWDLSEFFSEGGLREYEFFPAWPRRVEDWQFFMNPTIADLNGDDLPEVINGNGGYLVDAFDVTGAQPEGWPKLTGGWIVTSPAVGDLDGDGLRDVVAGTRNGYLFAWRTTASACGVVEWESFHHDLANTGNYEMPLMVRTCAPVIDDNINIGGGRITCGCRVGVAADGGAPAAVLVLLVLVGACLRRRRIRAS